MKKDSSHLQPVISGTACQPNPEDQAMAFEPVYFCKCPSKYLRLILSVVALLPLFAMIHSEAQTKPAMASTANAGATFARKFEPLQSKILDDNARFSGSQMLADLMALEAEAKAIGSQSAELTKLYSMLSLLQLKRNVHDEAVRFGELALKANAASKALTVDESVRTHERLRKIYQNDEDYKQALTHAQRAVALAPSNKDLTEAQRLGLQVSLGFLLHETKQYARALETNRKTLQEAEKIYSADASELGSLLINIAQNLHATNNPGEAKTHLERVLRIARKHKDTEREFDMLFQLGVLAYEGNDDAAAKRYFNDCMQVANKAKDDELRDKARGYLKQLADKSMPRGK
jgi:tetratricopeptide (TPR) repeat protein